MLVLWNGEYEEHDISEFYATKSGAEKNLERMELEYAKYPGTVVGDFTCLKVEYDWGKRDQRWTIKCNLCGRESYQYHTADWRKGKGRSLECKCRKDAKQAEKESYHLMAAHREGAKVAIDFCRHFCRLKPSDTNGLRVLGVAMAKGFPINFSETIFL